MTDQRGLANAGRRCVLGSKRALLRAEQGVLLVGRSAAPAPGTSTRQCGAARAPPPVAASQMSLHWTTPIACIIHLSSDQHEYAY